MEIHLPNIYGTIELATNAGASGQYLSSNGAGATPSWVSATTNITLVGCVLPPLIEGNNYKISGLTQGTLGSFTVWTRAVSTTQLDCFVTILAAGETSGQTYEGWMNWNQCLLEEVHDIRHNIVRGITNISNFKWFATNTFGNFIESTAIILPSPTINTNQLVQNNKLYGSSSLDLAGLSATLNVVANVLVDTALVLSGTGTKTVTSNTLSGADIHLQNNFSNTLVFNTITDGSINNTSTKSFTFSNNITNASNISLDTNVSTTITNSSLLNSDITLTNTVTGTSSITLNKLNLRASSFQNTGATTVNAAMNLSNSVVASSALNTTGTFSNTVTFTNTDVSSNSVINFLGTLAVLNVNKLVASNASVANLTGGTITSVTLEIGTFTNAGFNAIRSRLQDATSTLIANVTDASKSGYINLLP